MANFQAKPGSRPKYLSSERVFLSCQALRDDVVEAIARELASDTTTKELFLSANNITDVSAKDIFRALASNASLRLLALSDNLITDESVLVLGQALKTNTTLKELALANNKIGNGGALVLATTAGGLEKLSLARTVTDARLGNSDIKEAGAQALISAHAGRIDLDLRGLTLPPPLSDLVNSRKAVGFPMKHTISAEKLPAPPVPRSGSGSNVSKDAISQLSTADYLAAVNAEMEALKREAEMEKYEFDHRTEALNSEILRQLYALRTENAVLKDELAMKKAALAAITEDVGIIAKRHGLVSVDS